MRAEADAALGLLVVLGVLFLMFWRPRWRPSRDAHGTARFASDRDLVRAGMDRGEGLPLGRSLESGSLIWLRDYIHLSIFAPAGAGKSVMLIGWLLSCMRNAVVLDVKAELYKATAHVRRRMGHKVFLLDPFNVAGEGTHRFNPLDLLEDGPGCIDDCRSLAEAFVLRTGNERDPFWADSAANVLTMALTALTLVCPRRDRNLAGLRRLLTDPGSPDENGNRVPLLDKMAAELQAGGGVYRNLAGLIFSLEDKTRSSVLATCTQHTAFADSLAILGCTGESDFDVRDLLTGRATLYFVLPAHQLEAQARFLRLGFTSLVRLIGREGTGREILFLLDECGQIGPMPAIDQALTLMRSYGLRLVMAFQSLTQLKQTFKEKEGIVLDNTQLLAFGTQSYETAKFTSEMLGSHTITVSSYTENDGRSHNVNDQNPSVNLSTGTSVALSVIQRALLTPDEILRLHPDLMIAFLRGVPPLVCRRLVWWREQVLVNIQKRR